MRWNSNLYDDQHQFVSDYGADVLQWLNAQPDENILDIGCGTGDLAFKISESGAKVVGTDSSPDMIILAKQKFPHMIFDVIDATKLPFENQFEAVFSNATFHWIKDQDSLIRGIYKSLKTKGRLVAEFGGKGNIESIQKAILEAAIQLGLETKIDIDFWYFPSIGEYASRLERQGFDVEKIWLFDRPTPLKGEEGMLHWINQFGVNAFKNLNEGETQALKQLAVNLLRPNYFTNGEWQADYRRLRIKAIKNN